MYMCVLRVRSRAKHWDEACVNVGLACIAFQRQLSSMQVFFADYMYMESSGWRSRPPTLAVQKVSSSISHKNFSSTAWRTLWDATMSGKIKAKDLSYDSTLPPFLQRLHDQNAGRGDLDRHERAIARPRKEKVHDDEDEPTVVDESGETLSKDEVAKLTTTDDGNGEDGSAKGQVDADTEHKASGVTHDGIGEAKRVEQRLTDGTATKKRKAVKVVGDEDATGDTSGEKVASKKTASKPKKKAKPIKLAFDDEDVS